MTTYLIYRGALWLGTAATEAEAMARQASETGTRIVVRRCIRPWWLRPADWSVVA